MKGNLELSQYMAASIEAMVADILKATLQNPRETAFLLRYRESNRANTRKREAYEATGQHIPAFLISSVTNSCNLFCKGCYARANGLCGQHTGEELLTADQWRAVFDQASALGITFSLLAGGEPLLRRDVMLQAAQVRDIIFPVFTNGTLIDNEYVKLFDRHRNLIPVLSMEGGRERTDERRAPGTYGQLIATMDALHAAKILYGVSLTVTTQNLDEVTSPVFLDELHKRGCRLVFYVEYVPVDGQSAQLAPAEPERLRMEAALDTLRTAYGAMAFMSFPGDEKFLGGCLAAGRGFFHINPYGAAEACPFSPYSDRSVKTHTLLEALQSPFFRRLQDDHLVGGEHDGGCALFQHEARVRALLGDAGR